MVTKTFRVHWLRCMPGGLLALSCGLLAADDGKGGAIDARLTGYQEVPSVSTDGHGRFKARIDKRSGEIDYVFTYDGMQGSVTQAHIHFGQQGFNGGVSVWLCQSATSPAPAPVVDTTPQCTSPAGSFSGRITAASVVGPGGAQQLGAGEIDELAAAMQAGVAYVNVHTSLSPGGEVRGQIGHGHRH